eukprot:TRINITY_DN2972_c0_g1_i1.p1 TRINITY_DN2972_c0_g1~~TRINITY_DN2972_c0_g1_i1.p1  ORF type:complete len:468 (-),score=121.07 TRINITY_DN2972_c0_g1_i1:1284-2651(-)
MNDTLAQVDNDIFELIKEEKRRQVGGLELIASENFVSAAVLEALGSCCTNKYAEGLPGARYYGGSEVVDKIENLCQQRALDLFGLDPEEWGVNVQPYSGSPANLAVYTGLLDVHDRIMGLNLPDGGHLTHGYKVSATSKFWESLSYNISPETGLIDYDNMEFLANKFTPKILICGASAYPREWDYARIESIADSIGAYVMTDMAHIAGLVAGGAADSPFQFSDIVTTTTHKTLRGPRAGLIFYRLKAREGYKSFHKKPKKKFFFNLKNKINSAVFPGLQGGPHMNAIAAIAVALGEANTDEFKEHTANVVKNTQTLCKYLMDQGYSIVSNGSDNHLLLWNLGPLGLTGSKFEYICDNIHITLNKNTILGQTNALSPKGVRIGTAALTSRNFGEEDIVKVGEFLHRAAQLSIALQDEMETKKLVEFKRKVRASEDVKALSEEIHQFSLTFPMPGYV